MYCNFFGFREKPFHITPNPRFIYLSKNHKEAFAHLLYGIDGHAGFIELTGEVGTGKTTVLRTILDQLDDSTHRTALILNPCLSALELLRCINREFGILHEGLENGPLLDELNRFLLAENREGRTVVLVIDEAQNLAPQVLEQVRLISNLETESDKLIQIVLAGQPELKALLENPDLRQLSQRITVRYHLLPMDFNDSRTYIQHRLVVAGGKGKVNFSHSALRRIYRFSKGSPRLINMVCDRALLIGYTEESREITGPMASQAVKELRIPRILFAGRRAPLIAATGLAVIMLIGSVAIPRLQSVTRQSQTVVSKSSAADTATAPETGTPLPASTSSPWLQLPVGPYPALNAVLPLWGLPAIPQEKSAAPIASIVRKHGLSTIPIGSIDRMLRLDMPAILEIWPDKGKLPRLLAVTAVGKDSFRVMPAIPGYPNISHKEMGELWTGRGRIIWKNHRNIPTTLTPGATGENILELQNLLVSAALFREKPDGIFNESTIRALKAFQTANGIDADGQPGEQTLLLLYRNDPKFAVPRLSSSTGKKS
jgi:general secretion pathway protein A